jgi:hypothetical protein
MQNYDDHIRNQQFTPPTHKNQAILQFFKQSIHRQLIVNG